MSAVTTSPRWSWAACWAKPVFSATKVMVAVARTVALEGWPVSQSRPEGVSRARTRGVVELIEGVDDAGHAGADLAVEAGAEHGVDDEGGELPVGGGAVFRFVVENGDDVEAQGGVGVVVDLRVAVELGGVGHGVAGDAEAEVVQVPGECVAVAAVVPAAAEDGDSRVGAEVLLIALEEVDDEGSRVEGGVFHEDDRGQAEAFDGELIDAAGLVTGESEGGVGHGRGSQKLEGRRKKEEG